MAFVEVTLLDDETTVYLNANKILFICDDCKGGSFVDIGAKSRLHVNESPKTIMQAVQMQQFLEIERKKL